MTNTKLCPNCSGKLVPVGERTGGFSAGKAVAGAVIAGPAGVVAGALGKKLVTLQCEKCGYTVETTDKEAQAAKQYGNIYAPMMDIQRQIVARDIKMSIGMTFEEFYDENYIDAAKYAYDLLVQNYKGKQAIEQFDSNFEKYALAFDIITYMLDNVIFCITEDNVKLRAGLRVTPLQCRNAIKLGIDSRVRPTNDTIFVELKAPVYKMVHPLSEAPRMEIHMCDAYSLRSMETQIKEKISQMEQEAKQAENQAKETQLKAEQSRQWESQGLCRYCGGIITGIFAKKCKSCGMKK